MADDLWQENGYAKMEKAKYYQICKLELRGIAHKVEELDRVLSEKKNRVAITESKKEIEGYKGNQ